MHGKKRKGLKVKKPNPPTKWDKRNDADELDYEPEEITREWRENNG